VHDKQIRRRRAVLALLVVISLALITEYFGESANSPLHSVQRGIATVLSPLQDGASKVLSPFRDVAGYVSSTFSAKSKLARLERENHALTHDLAIAQLQATRNARAAAILKLDQSYSLSSYGPESANVTGRDPLLWYQTITVDKGSGAGVHEYDPVVGPGGLVGYVKTVSSDSSDVMLLTSPKFSVGAMIENDSQAGGLIQPQVGNPSTLTLIDLPNDASNISYNQLVVTNGFQDPNNPAIESYAPPGIPIGTVSTTNPQQSVLTSQQVQVTPLADLQNLSVVQILTRPHNGA
jgi:rod shape-determining protein MreC